MFPDLTDAQIERFRGWGHVRPVKAGETLFQPGDTNIPLYLILSGRLQIAQPTLDGEREVVTHGPGKFTGEMAMITGQRCFVYGRVTEPGEFIEITAQNLRSLMARDADLSDVLMRAFILRRLHIIKQGFGNIILMGSRHSARTLQLREFLTRNAYPHTYIDLDVDRASQSLLDRLDVKASDIPVVVCNARNVLRNPSIQAVADCLGFNSLIDGKQLRDVIIIGAGPAGLAAAVYGASEGLDVLMIEPTAPGGQAGSSSKIENYLGFPTGVSGQELSARALTQAQKFGAKMMIARSVVRLHCDQRPFEVELDSGESLAARAIVIASGAQYNKPRLANLEKYEGEGIYYGATYIESQLCEQDDVIVVGGGNSAGQAAVFLAGTAHKVHMLVRSGELSSTMSRYLIQRIVENPGIDLHLNTEIVELEGDGALERVTWRDKSTGQTSTHGIRHIFVMTGASPRTDWLQGCLALDEKGFILTGRDLESPGVADEQRQWPLARAPQMLETSLPGVFAVGDVRSGNVKRVASAVGEGAISIHMVHRTLAEL